MLTDGKGVSPASGEGFSRKAVWSPPLNMKTCSPFTTVFTAGHQLWEVFFLSSVDRKWEVGCGKFPPILSHLPGGLYKDRVLHLQAAHACPMV